MNLKFLIPLILFITALPIFAQEETNNLDNQGKRHGYWKEYYDDSKSEPKFEGQFKNGKRIGTFKFYEEGIKQPVAIMDFNETSNRAKAKFLTQQGKTISEGELMGQQRIGLWTYYHKNSDKIMMTENYVDGKLHGQKNVYYEDGTLAEESNYMNGKLHGNRKLYSETGSVLENLNYNNGELHGPAKFYNGQGEVVSEGKYKNDKHHGTWRYYENGKLKEEKDY